ncbi:MAG: hypothetical protein ACKVOR_13850 [Flavobacteriales bacterium]
MKKAAAHIILWLALATGANAQCTNYNIAVSLGFWPFEVSWQLVNSGGTVVASGFAGANQVVCLPDGCYTFNMFDSFGDGWNGATFTISAPGPVVVASGTFSSGFFAAQQVTLGNVNCCPAGTASYNINVTAGIWPGEVSWQLRTSAGALVANGGAPYNASVCLAPGCYRFYLFDSFGDGWNGSTYTISQGAAVIATGTMLTGDSEIDFVSIGGVSCTPTCAAGESLYMLTVTGGIFPGEVSWNLLNSSNVSVANGGAPNAVYFCAANGCFTLQMFDSFGDGWNGAEFFIYDELGNETQTGTLSGGAAGSTPIEIGTADCGIPDPITASDCITAVDICENFAFAIDPNGSGLINEIPPLGSIGNPDYIVDGANSPWGTDHYGCLRANELNSTWMIINIWQGGMLNFTFGGMGTQAGFYDWIMYPYDSLDGCQDIYNNVLQPVRCNWNMAATGGTGLQSVIPAGGNAGNYEPPLLVATGNQYIICFSNYSSATTVVPLDFSGTAVVGCTPLMLPVSLLHFTAEEQSGMGALTWATASEVNNAWFEVEHLDQDGQWLMAGRLAGNGTVQTTTNYAFTHRTPHEGTNYYRLRQVDYNGTATYSDVRTVYINHAEAVLMPNPNKGRFRLSGAVGTIRICNAQGARVSCLTLTNGEYELQHAVPGLYFVTDMANGQSWRMVVD